MPLHLRVLAPLLAVLAAACTSLPDPAAPPADLAIVGVNVIPMDAPGRVLAEHTVLIGDGRILALGPAHETTSNTCPILPSSSCSSVMG